MIYYGFFIAFSRFGGGRWGGGTDGSAAPIRREGIFMAFFEKIIDENGRSWYNRIVCSVVTRCAMLLPQEDSKWIDHE